jgi:hypothetical protein
MSALPALDNIKVIALDASQMEAARAEFLSQWRQIVASK